MIRHRGLNVAHILHALEDRLVDGKDEDGGLEFPKVDSDEEADYVVTFAHGLEVDRVQHQLSLSHFQGKFWIFTPVFRIRFFSPDSDQSPNPDFAKNLDPIRKNPDPDSWKKRPKTGVKVENIVITYLDLSILSFLVGQAPPKP